MGAGWWRTDQFKWEKLQDKTCGEMWGIFQPLNLSIEVNVAATAVDDRGLVKLIKIFLPGRQCAGSNLAIANRSLGHK